jgi:hypothetical protein
MFVKDISTVCYNQKFVLREVVISGFHCTIKAKSRFLQKLSHESFKLVDQSELNWDKIFAQWNFCSF